MDYQKKKFLLKGCYLNENFLHLINFSNLFKNNFTYQQKSWKISKG